MKAFVQCVIGESVRRVPLLFISMLAWPLAASAQESPAEATPPPIESAEEQPAPSAPGGEVGALPPVEVPQPAKPKPKPKAKPVSNVPKRPPRPVSSTSTAASAAQPEAVPVGGGSGKGRAVDAMGTPTRTGGSAETAYGPVDGFVATRSGTGMKTDTPIVEIPQSISVITADRMEQLGANSLSEAVSYTAGVRPSIYGADSRYDWLSIRGFDAYFPGFYFDNLFARNNNTWAVWKVEPYGAERIEVLKGPASVLYGQMGPGGLVNVVTKRPTEQPFREAGIEIGNFSRVEPFFDIGGPATEDGKFLYRLTGLGLSTDTQVNFVDEERFYFAPGVTWKPSADTSLTILGHYLHEKTGVTSNFLPAEGTLLPNPNGKIPRSFFSGEPNFDGFDQEQWAITYFFEHRFNDVWEFRQNARYGGIDLNFDSLYGTGLDPADPTKRLLARRSFFSQEDVDQFVIDNQMEAKFTTGTIEHTMLFGTDYQWNRFDQRSGDGDALPIDMYDPIYNGFFGDIPLFANANTFLTQTGVYAQDQAKLFDRLVLVGGIRYDWAETKIDDHLFGENTEQKDEDFTWRAGVVYLMPNDIAPYFSYSTSFLPVSGFDPFTLDPFDPETGQQYEVGVKYQPPGRKSLFTVSAFDIKRQNYLTFDNFFNPRQTGEVWSRGMEFEAVTELADGLDLIAAYTWLPEFTITETADPIELDKREPLVPEHMASLWSHYQFQSGKLRGFGFGGGVRYIGETFGDSANTPLMVVPSITLFDAVIDYEMQGWRFALNVQNIEDKTYVASCWDTCYYGSARTVIGSIRRRW